ncbi:DUF4157 domain-containing protein [Candidatus Poribacteria bacterium]|nr:DUF4157 domain-containing protein [Candidatus Poribacteria bacterium]
MQQRHKTTQVSQKRDSQSNMQIRQKTEESLGVKHHSHPLENITCRIGDNSCAAKHVSVVQRTGLFHPMNENQKVQSLLKLQRQYGNRFVQRVIVQHVIQTKLQVSQPGDIYEQEADRVAEKVMQMPEPQMQRQPIEEEEEIQMVQRQPIEEEEEKLQAKELPDQIAGVNSNLESRINVIRGSGQPLPDSDRAFFEPRFGYDFSQVRVHKDSQAAEAAHVVNARAFTMGRNIVFGAGEYEPATSRGKHLLAHELVHVVQQNGGAPARKGIRNPHQDSDSGTKTRWRQGENRASGFHASIATAGGVSLDDEPFKVTTKPSLTAQAVANQTLTPGISASNVPAIQRAANFVAGTVNATTNMAAHVIAGNMDAGFTPPTLNGAQILSAAEAQKAMKVPIVLTVFNPVSMNMDSWVVSVPTNEASFTMRVPSNGPWSTTTTKANVAALFALLGLAAQAGCATSGNTTFTVNGKPSDSAFAANVRTHENLHATDHQTGFKSITVPWDKNLQAAETAGTKFSGKTKVDAEAALFRAMGGTPNQIAAAQFAEWIRLNNVTHTGMTLATGGPATPSNSAANKTCTTSSMDVT